MESALLNITIPSIFVSHKRGLDRIHPKIALLKIDHVTDRKTAEKYSNNAVLYTYVNKEGETIYNNGIILKPHGKKGVVQAKFERNLPPKAIGQGAYVKLYKIEKNQ